MFARNCPTAGFTGAWRIWLKNAKGKTTLFGAESPRAGQRPRRLRARIIGTLFGLKR